MLVVNNHRLGGVAAFLSDQDIYDTVILPGTATATYTLNQDGNAQYETSAEGGGVINISGQWKVSGAASAFEARATVVSGSVSTGTTGSWLGLGTTRTWTRSRNTLGTSAVTLTIEIRRVSDSVVIATATVVLSATGEAA